MNFSLEIVDFQVGGDSTPDFSSAPTFRLPWNNIEDDDVDEEERAAHHASLEKLWETV